MQVTTTTTAAVTYVITVTNPRQGKALATRGGEGKWVKTLWRVAGRDRKPEARRERFPDWKLLFLGLCIFSPSASLRGKDGFWVSLLLGAGGGAADGEVRRDLTGTFGNGNRYGTGFLLCVEFLKGIQDAL